MKTAAPYHLPRIFTQSASLVIFNSYFFQSTLKYIPCIGLNCYACPLAVFACPLGTLQHILIIGEFPFFTLGILLLYAIVFGRFVCGWFCPFGFFQEILYKIPFPKKFTFKSKSYFPFLVLICLIILIPLITKEPWFCKLCPIGTLEAGIPLVLYTEEFRPLIGWLYWLKIFILAVIIGFSIVIFRPFCQFFCPLGAIYSLSNRFSMMQVALSKNCVSCNLCESYCPLSLDPVTQANSLKCLKCMECSKCSQIKLSFSFVEEKGQNGQ